MVMMTADECHDIMCDWHNSIFVCKLPPILIAL